MMLHDRLSQSPKLAQVLGFLFFIGMMSVGYYYNLTFIQLGLVDLGAEQVGISQGEIALAMTLLALLTCLVAIAFGFWITAHHWGEQFVLRLRFIFMVVLGQMILTALALVVHTQVTYYVWIVACSLLLGLGVPLTFSLTVDLVPRRARGTAAALVTAIAYLAANTVPASWQVADFVIPLLWVMPAGVVALGFLAFGKLPLVDTLANQHNLPDFYHGRYIKQGYNAKELVGLILLMFGIFFVDSLGFLRLLDTPRLMQSAWQSPDYTIRLVIGIVHVVGAFIGGVLYTALDIRQLFYWIFGIFSLVHLMYTLGLRTSNSTPALIIPALYALAVSLYTVVNFAVWADISTPKTIGRNAAIGVALSGWTATFISTGLAIWWQTSGMPLERHLNIVNALAMLFFLVMVLQAYLPRGNPNSARGSA